MNARTLAGYSLLILGVAGCLLPIIPGIPMLLGGAALLGRDHPVVRRWLPKRFHKEGSSQTERDGDQ